jgi:hypothetical protein
MATSASDPGKTVELRWGCPECSRTLTLDDAEQYVAECDLAKPFNLELPLIAVTYMKSDLRWPVKSVSCDDCAPHTPL